MRWLAALALIQHSDITVHTHTHLFNQEHATPFYNPIINIVEEPELELQNFVGFNSVLNLILQLQVRFFASSRVVYGMLVAKYCGTSQQFRGFCIERGSGDTLLCLFGQWKNAFKLLDTRSGRWPFCFLQCTVGSKLVLNRFWLCFFNSMNSFELWLEMAFQTIIIVWSMSFQDFKSVRHSNSKS